jgi:hypothetical protein
VLLQRHMEAVPVVGPAQKHRVLPGVQEPASQRQVRADPAGAAQGSQAAPAQVQAEQVGEAQVSDGNDAVTVLYKRGIGLPARIGYGAYRLDQSWKLRGPQIRVWGSSVKS